MNKNIPNILSGIRIALVPFFVFFYLVDVASVGKWIALAIFIVASLTDLLDGKIARKYNFVSDLGKLLDPIADKILVLSALVLVIWDLVIPQPYGIIALIIIISRDYVVDALRQIGASKGKVISADIFGKMKTMVTMIALTFMLIYVAMCGLSINPDFLEIFRYVCFVLFAFAVLLTIMSGINYVVKNKHLFSAEANNGNPNNSEKGADDNGNNN